MAQGIVTKRLIPSACVGRKCGIACRAIRDTIGAMSMGVVNQHGLSRVCSCVLRSQGFHISFSQHPGAGPGAGKE